MAVTKTNKRRVRDDYLDLVRTFPLRPIKTEAEHQEAMRILARIGARPDGKMTDGELDYVQALVAMLKEWDARNPFEHKRMTPLEAVKFLMEENHLNTEDLGKIIGTRTAASLFLHGKRELSKTHIRRLAERFKVDAGLFI